MTVDKKKKKNFQIKCATTLSDGFREAEASMLSSLHKCSYA